MRKNESNVHRIFRLFRRCRESQCMPQSSSWNVQISRDEQPATCVAPCTQEMHAQVNCFYKLKICGNNAQRKSIIQHGTQLLCVTF